MASFELTESARADLGRIYRRGLQEFGERRADEYYRALFERFDQIAANPQLFPTVDEIRPGVRRSVYDVDSIYYKLGKSGLEILAIVGGRILPTGCLDESLVCRLHIGHELL